MAFTLVSISLGVAKFPVMASQVRKSDAMTLDSNVSSAFTNTENTTSPCPKNKTH